MRSFAMSFGWKKFVEDCVRAASGGVDSVYPVVVEAAQEFSALAPVETIDERSNFFSPAISVVEFPMAPGENISPHKHDMYSIIAVCSGEEQHTLWREVGRVITFERTMNIVSGGCIVLGCDDIHSVSNRKSVWSQAIHIYGGDIREQSRRRREYSVCGLQAL